jgi:hypothetical protein
MGLLQSKEVVVTSATSASVTFDVTPRAGNTIVVAYSTKGVITGESVTDNAGNGSYSLVTEDSLNAGVNSVHLFYKANIATTSSFQVTVSTTGSAISFAVVIMEIDGQATPLNEFSGAGSGTSTTPTTGSITTTANNTFVVGAFTHAGSDMTITPGSSWYEVQENEGGTTTAALGVEFKTGDIATYQATWTLGTTAAYCSVIGSFKLRVVQGVVMHVPFGGDDFGWSVSNHTTRPAAAMGTSITPGNNTKGTPVQLLTALANDVYLVAININSNSVSAAARDTLVDIGIDEAGGTNYTYRIPDLIGSCASSCDVLGGIWYVFRLFIRAGSTIGARASVNNATVGTLRVWVTMFGRPRNPEMCKVGSYVEAIGVVAASSRGTTVTPGTTSDGTWTSIGSTTKELWWWQAGVGVNDSTMSALVNTLDVAVGSAGEMPLITDQLWRSDASERLSNDRISSGCERYVPAGTALYARMQCSGTADAAYSVAIYGVGG